MQGIVAYVTIDNARRLNAMNSALMGAFVDTMAGLAGDEHLRAVVLTGAGPKAFIVGADARQTRGTERLNQRAEQQLAMGL